MVAANDSHLIFRYAEVFGNYLNNSSISHVPFRLMAYTYLEVIIRCFSEGFLPCASCYANSDIHETEHIIAARVGTMLKPLFTLC